MLSAQDIIESREKPPAELPSFGIKDFQPLGSTEQSNEIRDSLLKIKNLISYEKIKVLNTLSRAVWHPELHLAEVTHQTGPYWVYMGHKIDQKVYIFPEEALYLLEIGSLQILYNGVPLSVQRAYYVLLNSENSISVEKYRVYSILTNYGYKVRRHSSQNSVTKYEKKIEVHKLNIKLKNYNSAIKLEKKTKELDNQCFLSKKKLKVSDTEAVPVVYNNFDGPCDDSKGTGSQPSDNNFNAVINLCLDYDIYSETSHKHSFRKSCLQLPNFRVIVHRSEDFISDLEELYNLSKIYKDEIPVIHAIVFFDYIAFYQLQPVILPDPLD